jgi:acetyl esterase/lipase
VPEAFLAVSLVGATFTLLAVAAPRRPAVLAFPLFIAGWVTGELALLHVAWQVVATVVFVALGALREPAGWAGLGVTALSWAALAVVARRQGTTAAVLTEAMGDALAGDRGRRVAEGAAVAAVVSRRQLLSPFRMHARAVERIPDLAYGEDRRHRLDLYRRRDGEGRRPVVLQIHGGAWVVGDKRQQGQPLLYHLAQRGWVGVAPNYRRSPRATFPDHLVDVKRALAWVRRHGPDYGADPGFVVVTGGSAGGHLAALVALTPDDPRYQPGFEAVDTAVQACVPMYGVYDFLDRHGVRGRDAMRPFLERFVMKCAPEECLGLWEAASPIDLVRPDAPPFFVVHGGHDTLAWVEDARFFVEALRAVSRNPVVYAELPHAQHAFDVMYSVRTAYVVDAIGRWLDGLRGVSRGPVDAAVDVDGVSPA